VLIVVWCLAKVWRVLLRVVSWWCVDLIGIAILDLTNFSLLSFLSVFFQNKKQQKVKK
jgi:hypothetical protein